MKNTGLADWVLENGVYYSAGDVARMAGVDLPTISRFVKTGGLPRPIMMNDRSYWPKGQLWEVVENVRVFAFRRRAG